VISLFAQNLEKADLESLAAATIKSKLFVYDRHCRFMASAKS